MYTTTTASVSAATTSTAVSYICLMAKVGMVHSSDVNIEFFKNPDIKCEDPFKTRISDFI